MILSLKMTFYDGTNCIGGNKILLEDSGVGLFMDFGTNFKAEGMYFDEFLQPRSTLDSWIYWSLACCPAYGHLSFRPRVSRRMGKILRPSAVQRDRSTGSSPFPCPF